MADASYIIDIAASLPDGATTIAELDALTESLTGAGRRGEDFQEAIKRISDQLVGAQAAAESANAALAAGSVEYATLEREALRASKAVERAAAKGKGAVPPELVQQARAAHEALDSYGVSLEHLEKTAAKANGEQKKLAGVLGNVNKIAARVDDRNAKSIEKYGRLQQLVSQLPGPFSRLGGAAVRAGQANAGLSASFGSTAATAALAAGAVLAVVVAVVAVTAAAIAGYVALVNYTIGLADAARSAALSREAFAALSVETAAGVGAFDAVRDATGATDQQLFALTKQLRAAKVAAGDMPAALRAAALAEAALGAGGASEFVDRIRSGETAVGEFAAEAEAKFGGVVSAQLRGLAGQGKRFDLLWGKLFSSVNIEPVLDALTVLVGMFDKANPLAASFGDAVQGAFEPISKYALDAAYAVEAFALGFAIQLTKIYLAVRPALRWLGELFDIDGSALLATIGSLGKAAAILALVMGGAVAVAVAATVGIFTTAMVPVLAFAAAIYGVVNSVVFLLSGLAKLGTWLFDIGTNLVAGLIDGILSMAPRVIGAIGDAIKGAIGWAEGLLEIGSPSKVFREIGAQTVAGFVGGIDANAGSAATSMGALVGPDVQPSATAATTAAPASSSTGKSFDFAGATFVFHGVENAESARGMFAEMLTSILEDDATSLGGALV